MEIDSRERRERASQIPRKRDPAGAQGLGKPCVNVVPAAASVKTNLGKAGRGRSEVIQYLAQMRSGTRGVSDNELRRQDATW